MTTPNPPKEETRMSETHISGDYWRLEFNRLNERLTEKERELSEASEQLSVHSVASKTSLDSIRVLEAQLATLKAENERLSKFVKHIDGSTDICTFDATQKPCMGCYCGRSEALTQKGARAL